MPNTLGFGLRFALFFALLMTAFEASRGTAFERFFVVDLILKPTAQMINVVTPGDHVVLADRSLVSAQGSKLNIMRGCEGIELFLLLISAIAAFRASLGYRLRGLLLGFALAYALSVGRIMALHYVLQYWPEAWESAHGIVLTLGPILVMTLFFLRWTALDGRGGVARISQEPHAT
jgi:exosortase family protein XrtM